MSKTSKPVAMTTAALTGGLLLAGAAFASTPLAQGYLLGAQDAATTAAADKAGGEGKCGMDKLDADKDGRVSRAEFGAAHAMDDSKFAAHDGNGDGFISADELAAHKAAHQGDKKAGMEGKCGEGKCGGSA